MINEYLNYVFEFKISLLVIGIFIFYKLGKIRYNLHLKLGHKGPPPIPYLGNFIQLFRYGFHEYDKMCLQKYGKIYPFYFGSIKQSMVSDENLLKQILVKDSKCFIDRLDIGFNTKYTEKMLTVLKGKDWERVRNLVTPTFTSGKLRKMSPLVHDGVNLLEKRLIDHPKDTPVDFKEFFGALTMDIIARTMFGMEIDSQTNPNNQFIINAKKLFNFSFFNPFIAIFLIFPETAKLLRPIIQKLNFMRNSILMFFVNNLKKAIDERQKSINKEEFNDFLALMLKAHIDIDENDPNQMKNLNSKSLTNQEIMAQSFIFLLAGYETTATALTYITYFLAKNPQAQEEVYGEILDTIGIGGEITYEALMNMPLLDAAVNETLRICPPAVRLDRQCTQNVTLITSDQQQIKAQKGDVFTVPIYAIHTDPEIWPEPHVFDLHRFDGENKKNHSPYSFMPFGMGPRNCVGMRFALFELKWAIVTVLRKFQIVPCAETLDEIKFKRSGLSAPIKPIVLKIVKRE